MMRAPCRVVLAAVLALASGATTARGEEPPGDAVPSFRRVFFPSDEIDRQPWKDGYLPIDAQEFEKRLASVHGRARGAPGADGARLERADYVARLEGDDLLSGTVDWHLAAETQPVLIPLDPFSAALESAAWQDPQREALLGTDPEGKLRLLVEGSRLTCRWSQRGERTASGAVRFALELPACPMSRLQIEAPATVEILADQGIVSSQPAAGGQAKRWTIEFGGSRRLVLRVVPEAVRERRGLTLLRQSMTYEFTSRGINVAAQLRLDVHGEPLVRAQVTLDPSLHLVSARYGEIDVPWSATSDRESGRSQVVLEFPQPIAGAGRVLQLSAVAPLTTDRRFALPGMLVENMAWQEGTADLLVPEALDLEQLMTDGCRQSQVTPLPAPLAESIQVQYFRPAAKIEVQLTAPRNRLSVESGTIVQVGMQGIVSRCSISFGLAADQRRQLRVPIHAPWTIEAVESVAANRPVDWEVDQREGEPPELKIAVTGPGRLVVRGRRPLPATAAFEAAQLAMLDFSQFAGATRLISARAGDGSELRWSGIDELAQVEPSNLTAEQLQLFVQLPDGPVFPENDAFTQASVTLERSRPNYATDIHLDAAVQRDALTETCTIQCVPDAARVDRLLIHFSQAREVPLEWNLAGGNNSGQFAARKLSPAEQASAGLPPGGEVWELTLQLTRTGPFELRAGRTIPFRSETPLALVSVDGATSQRGTLAIRALGNTGLTVANRGLMSVPAELLEANHYQTARATYHYQPSGDDLDAKPIVSIAPAKTQPAETGAWAWNGRLTSRLAADGLCSHRAVFHIQTAGQREIRLQLPAEATLRGAWLDGERLSPNWADPAKPFVVELSAGQSRSTLAVSYATPAALPALVLSQSAAFPELDIPVLVRNWSLSLPPGYEVVDGAAPVEQLTPPSWTQRLLGSLGRGPSGHIFNPLLGSDWREAFAGSADVQRMREAGVQFVRDLGSLFGEYIDDETLTWGQLLAAAAEREAQAGRALVVDAEQLAMAEILPLSRISGRAANSPLERGTGLLRDAGLVAIAGEGVILVTTGAGVTTLSPPPRVGVPEVVGAAPQSAWADEIRRAARGDEWSHFETVESWRNQSASQFAPWIDPQREGRAIGPQRGWNSYTLVCSATSTPRLRAVNLARMRSLEWAILLAVAGLGLWQLVRRPGLLVLVVACSAALALVLPLAYAALASAAFKGGLLALAIQLIRVPPRKAGPRDGSRVARRAHSSVVQGAATALALAAIVSAASSLDAAQLDEKPAAGAAADAPFTVIVPVDDNQQLSGGRYYVPEKLYQELRRLDDAASGRPKQWLVSRAVYRGALSRAAGSGEFELSRLRAQFDVHVLQAGVSVKLPVPREAWGKVITAARLDGRTIPLQWTPEGDALLLERQAAGECQLDLELAVPPPAGASGGFDLPIPKLAQSVLELEMPTDGPVIDVPEARGKVSIDSKRGLLVAELGSVDRLVLRWPAGGGQPAMTTNLEVEELIWIKVRPGTTVLDARFKYRTPGGNLQRVRLITDPRFRLLSTPGADSPIKTVHTIPGDPQRIELELAGAAAGEVVVDLSFLVTGTSGVGNLRLPRLESSDARASRRWLGVSVDPALQPRIQAGEDSRAVDIGEFMAAWGIGDTKPQAAYSIPRGEPIWVLSTQPSEPQTVVVQSLDVGLGRRAARLRYAADLAVSNGVLIQLALQGPPGLEVDDVSILENDVERVARFSVDPSGLVSVFLTTPIDGQQKLALRGQWEPGGSGGFDVPTLRVLNAEIKQNRVCVYRHPSVLATLEVPDGVQATIPPEPTPGEGLGSLVGCYALNGADARLGVKLSPNAPSVNAVAITALDHRRDQWIAELHYHLDVHEGFVDTLSFEIPPQWSEPFQVEPAMRTKVVTTPGDQRRRLIVYPAAPLSGRHVLKLTGRVAPSPGDRLSVPDIVPLEPQQLERYIVVPRFLDAQQVTWDALGLSPASLPAELLDALPDKRERTMAVFQVSGEHFQASLKAVQREGATARVNLADIQMAWLADGSYQAVAAFDIEPGGARQCVLKLPAQARLVHAAVERLPALIAPLAENRWRLGLGPEQLPQRVEIVYSGATADALGEQQFEAPRLCAADDLAELEVGETLWTIFAPPGSGPVAPRQSAWRATPAEQQLARLGSVASLMELPAEVIGEHLPEEIARWYGSWRQRFLLGSASLRREFAAHADSGTSPEWIEARQQDERMAAVDKRLGADRTPAREVGGDDAASLLSSIARANLRPSFYAVGTSPRAIDLRFEGAGGDRVAPRWLAALAIVAGGIASAWWMRTRPLPTYAPWAVVAAAGLVWWLLCVPSLIGLLALVVACGVALWTTYRGAAGDAAYRFVPK